MMKSMKSIGFRRIVRIMLANMSQVTKNCRLSVSRKWRHTLNGCTFARFIPTKAISSVPKDSGKNTYIPYSLGYGPVPGDFFILDRLGEGARGVVHRVIDKDSCVWAVKIIDKNNIPKTSMQREIDVMLMLRGSLNVATLHNVYEDDKNVYIVMEFIQNGHIIATSENDASRIIRSVCRVLKRLHENLLIHRDVKPSNFLMDDLGHVKSIDFGSVISVHDKNYGIEGTPLFMAPEAMNGSSLCSSDVWSLGVMTYFLVSGDFPFRDSRPLHAQRLVHVMRSVMEDPLRMEGDTWDQVSPAGKDFIERCLVRNTVNRMTINEALSHPWLKSISRRRASIYTPSMVKRLQKWSTYDRKKQSFLHLMANQIFDSTYSMTPDVLSSSIRDAGYTCSENDIKTITHALGNGYSIDSGTFVAAQIDTTDDSVKNIAYKLFENLSKDGKTIETCHRTIHKSDMDKMFGSYTSLGAFSSRESMHQ
jgi:serine/threonine protein kinase